MLDVSRSQTERYWMKGKVLLFLEKARPVRIYASSLYFMPAMGQEHG